MSPSPSSQARSDDGESEDAFEDDSSERSCLCDIFEGDKGRSPNVGRLREVAEAADCDMCFLLLDMAEKFGADDDAMIHVSHPREYSTDSFQDSLRVSYLADMDEDDILVSVFVPPGVESPHPSIRTLTPNSHYSGNTESLELAKRWLEECAANHKDCNNSSETPMPTRVIDVGADDRDPMLVETGGRPGQYATLSYCWGKKPQLKTTKETLPDLLKGIPVVLLQKTALDALEICRHLQIPYLWIDALCIVQDDEADWLRESSRMCEIYSLSTLTIVSAWSLNTWQGIFGFQEYGEPGHSETFEFKDTEVYARKLPLGEHVGTPLGVNIARQDTGRVAEKSWILRPQELPLARRAWTVQERVLSRRALYYTSQELWWECDSFCTCECGWVSYTKEYELGPDYDFDAVQEANTGSFGWLRDPRRCKSLTLEQAYQRWASVVSLFSAGKLTVLSDKLPALSGIAQQFQRALKMRFDVSDDYLAGMWRQDLAQQLLWVIGPYVGRPRLAPYPTEAGIPTWSWTSVNGVISYAWEEQEDGLDPLFTIREASVELDTSDPTGKIRGGKLVLESAVSHGHRLGGVPHAGNILASLVLQPSGSRVSFYADRADELDPEALYSCLSAAGGGNAGSDWVMVLKPSRKAPGAYERVGLGLVSRLFGDAKKQLWKNAQTEAITIV